MKLAEISASDPVIPWTQVGGDKQLAAEVQARLSAVGLLDPPADGLFGPVSKWAAEEFMRRVKEEPDGLNRGGADALLSDDLADKAFPILSGGGDGLAERIAVTAAKLGYWLCRHPDARNIVYVEGMEQDSTPNENIPNSFNDLRLLFRVNKAGRPIIDEIWQATTEPGEYYTKIDPQDPRGAARIAFGQYKAWTVGMHPKTGAAAHEALVQVADIKIFRDLNRDFSRMGDQAYSGVFGINQHWGYDMPRKDIGRTSAGCLVGRTRAGHREFMASCKADPRYVANNGYRFMTTILSSRHLQS